MTGYLDKLNLRPQERRLVVIVGIAVFLVLNLLLVFPHFGDLRRLEKDRKKAATDLQTYQAEVAKEVEYQREYDRLKSMGQYVASDAQALELAREVQSQAVKCNVGVQRWDPMRTSLGRTNSFFDETSLTITVNTFEKELIDFLWALSGQGSLTRVRTLSLRRDPTQMKLAGEITFVKSFQRRPPPKAPSKTSPAVKAMATALRTPTNAPAKAAAVAKGPTNAPKVLPAAARSASNAPPKTVAGLAKPAAKPGPSRTNAVPAAAKGQANPSPTNAGFIKRVLSKWF